MLAHGDRRNPRPSARLAGTIPWLGAGGPRAGIASGSGVSRRRGACPSRRHRPAKPAWAGVFRQRLALAAAAASVARAGRAEDEAALRDAFHLTRRGADPGPAGRSCSPGAARRPPTRQWRSSLVAAAEVLGIAPDEAMQEALEVAAAGVESARRRRLPRPEFSPGKRSDLGRAPVAEGPGRGGRGAAAWLADAVLAAAAELAVALPMLAAQLRSPERVPRPAISPTAPRTTRVLFAYTQAAAQACDLSAELGRRAQKLFQAAPQLRAKGAGAALRAPPTTTRSAPRRQPAGSPSAARDGCSTGSSRSTRFAN